MIRNAEGISRMLQAKGGKRLERGFVPGLQPKELVELRLGFVTAPRDLHQRKCKLVVRCWEIRPQANRLLVLGNGRVQTALRPPVKISLPNESVMQKRAGHEAAWRPLADGQH
jgi:hypothetical protein